MRSKGGTNSDLCPTPGTDDPVPPTSENQHVQPRLSNRRARQPVAIERACPLSSPSYKILDAGLYLSVLSFPKSATVEGPP